MRAVLLLCFLCVVSARSLTKKDTSNRVKTSGDVAEIIRSMKQSNEPDQVNSVLQLIEQWQAWMRRQAVNKKEKKIEEKLAKKKQKKAEKKLAKEDNLNESLKKDPSTSESKETPSRLLNNELNITKQSTIAVPSGKNNHTGNENPPNVRENTSIVDEDNEKKTDEDKTDVDESSDKSIEDKQSRDDGLKKPEHVNDKTTEDKSKPKILPDENDESFKNDLDEVSNETESSEIDEASDETEKDDDSTADEPKDVRGQFDPKEERNKDDLPLQKSNEIIDKNIYSPTTEGLNPTFSRKAVVEQELPVNNKASDIGTIIKQKEVNFSVTRPSTIVNTPQSISSKASVKQTAIGTTSVGNSANIFARLNSSLTRKLTRETRPFDENEKANDQSPDKELSRKGSDSKTLKDDQQRNVSSRNDFTEKINLITGPGEQHSEKDRDEQRFPTLRGNKTYADWVKRTSSSVNNTFAREEFPRERTNFTAWNNSLQNITREMNERKEKLLNEVKSRYNRTTPTPDTDSNVKSQKKQSKPAGAAAIPLQDDITRTLSGRNFTRQVLKNINKLKGDSGMEGNLPNLPRLSTTTNEGQFNVRPSLEGSDKSRNPIPTRSNSTDNQRTRRLTSTAENVQGQVGRVKHNIINTMANGSNRSEQRTRERALNPVIGSISLGYGTRQSKRPLVRGK